MAKSPKAHFIDTERSSIPYASGAAKHSNAVEIEYRWHDGVREWRYVSDTLDVWVECLIQSQGDDVTLGDA